MATSASIATPPVPSTSSVPTEPSPSSPSASAPSSPSMPSAPSTPSKDIEATPDNLFKAVSVARLRTLNALLEQGIDINIQDNTLKTPLMRAVFIAKQDVRTHIVRLLIHHGADVNIQDIFGKTALAYSCIEEGRDDVVRQIIRAGRKCDLNLADSDGNTPLMHACKSNNYSVIRILVNSAYSKRNIHVNKTNKQGIPPIAMAFKLGHSRCCSVLVKEGQADTTCIQDKETLAKMLNDGNQLQPIPSHARQNNSILSLRNGSTSSLRLDKISIHSKSSFSSEDFPSPETLSYNTEGDVFQDTIPELNTKSKRTKAKKSKKKKSSARDDSINKLGRGDMTKLLEPEISLNISRYVGIDGPAQILDPPTPRGSLKEEINEAHTLNDKYNTAYNTDQFHNRNTHNINHQVEMSRKANLNAPFLVSDGRPPIPPRKLIGQTNVPLNQSQFELKMSQPLSRELLMNEDRLLSQLTPYKGKGARQAGIASTYSTGGHSMNKDHSLIVPKLTVTDHSLPKAHSSHNTPRMSEDVRSRSGRRPSDVKGNGLLPSLTGEKVNLVSLSSSGSYMNSLRAKTV